MLNELKQECKQEFTGFWGGFFRSWAPQAAVLLTVALALWGGLILIQYI